MTQIRTYIPEKHKLFWKRHIFAAAYGNFRSSVIVKIVLTEPKTFDFKNIYKPT